MMSSISRTPGVRARRSAWFNRAMRIAGKTLNHPAASIGSSQGRKSFSPPRRCRVSAAPVGRRGSRRSLRPVCAEGRSPPRCSPAKAPGPGFRVCSPERLGSRAVAQKLRSGQHRIGRMGRDRKIKYKRANQDRLGRRLHELLYRTVVWMRCDGLSGSRLARRKTRAIVTAAKAREGRTAR